VLKLDALVVWYVKPDSIFKPAGLKHHEFEIKIKMCDQSERAPMTAPVDPKWNWWSFCP
jgi:hypothetical protein